MPFGLSNALTTFQAIMNIIFRPYLRKFVIVFFFLMTYWCTVKNWDDHLHHLEQVLRCLQQHKFFVKQSKCSFARESIDYLGHIVIAEGVKPDE